MNETETLDDAKIEIIDKEVADVIQPNSPPIEIPAVDLSTADYIIAKIQEARKQDNRMIKKTFEEMEARVQEQLPKLYSLKLELDSIKNCTSPRLRVVGPVRDCIIDINSKKFNIHEALAKSIRWAFKDLAERKIGRIWKTNESEGKNE